MERHRFFRLLFPLLAGITLWSVVVLALSPPVPVAAEPLPNPQSSPHTQSYTGALQFDGTAEISESSLQGSLYVNRLEPLKVKTSWACSTGLCGYTDKLEWNFMANGAEADTLVVCATGENPGHYFGGCTAQFVPPQSMYGVGCSNPGLTQDCYAHGDFPRYWSSEHGAYCYDVTNMAYFKSVGWNHWLKSCPEGATGLEWYITVMEVDGLAVSEEVTECIEVESVTLTGPATATVGIAELYELSWSTSEPAEVETIIGVDMGGIANGPTWSTTGDNYKSFYLRWLIQGVHTVTARVETPCSYGEDSVTTEITSGIPISLTIPLLPIGDCDTDDPDSACYFDPDSCPPGESWWDFGGWIQWLKCWLVYLFGWLGRVMLWIGLSIVNAFISVFNVILHWDGGITSDIVKWIEWQGLNWSNFVETTLANFGHFLRDHILVARNWMYAGLTWVADQFEIGSDLLGDNIEAFFTELGDWTLTNLTEVGQTANESITNWGAARADDIDHFRDWSYEGLMELADYFSSWGTGLGNFLALCVTVFADFWYWILTQISTFVRNFTDALGNMVEGAMIKLGQFLYVLLVSIGRLLNTIITGLGLFIANIIRMFRDTLYFWMTVLAYAVDGFFVGLGKFLGMVIRGVAEFAKLVVLAFNALMAGLSYALQLALFLAQAAVDAILEVYATVIWFAQLVLKLLNAFVEGLQSDTTPEMYTGAEGLYYFWEGLAFFETISESSPLATLNTIAIAFIGINLLFWTFRQITDTISDLLHFA